MIVFWKDDEQHLKNIEEILGLLGMEIVSLKMQKCGLLSGIVYYLGHKIRPVKLTAALEPTKAIEKTPFWMTRPSYFRSSGLASSIDGSLESVPE